MIGPGRIEMMDGQGMVIGQWRGDVYVRHPDGGVVYQLVGSVGLVLVLDPSDQEALQGCFDALVPLLPEATVHSGPETAVLPGAFGPVEDSLA